MALVRQTTTRKDLPHIAIVIHKSNEDLANEPSPRLQFAGARAYAERMGFHADVFNLVESPLSPKRLREILIARGIQGILFVATVSPEMPEEYFDIGQEFACAIVGIRYPNTPYHVVINDYLGACRLAIQKILEAGHERIGVIIPRGVDAPLGYSFTGGFSTGLVEVPKAKRLPILHIGNHESHIEDDELDTVAQWLRWKRPDAVISTDILHCRILQDRLAAEGIHFDLYSADWQPDQPVVGGINLRQRQLGEAAVDVVVAQLHRGRHGLPEVQRSIHVGGIWMDNPDEDGPEPGEAGGPGTEEVRTLS